MLMVALSEVRIVYHADDTIQRCWRDYMIFWLLNAMLCSVRTHSTRYTVQVHIFFSMQDSSLELYANNTINTISTVNTIPLLGEN